MIPEHPVTMHPEFEKQLKELDLLKAEYANQWNKRQVLLDWGKPQLEALYYARIGELQVQLLQWQAETYAAKRKLEMMQAALNRNEEINLPFIELVIEMEIKEQIEKIENEVQKLASAKHLLAHLDSPERSHELRKIFREMAKELHPDINPDLPESGRHLWNAAMLAYESGDLESLRALRLLVSEVKNNHQPFTDDTTLQNQISLLKEGIALLLQEIENIRAEFPFTIEKQLSNDEWVQEQRKTIQEQIETERQRKAAYEKSIALIIQTLDL